jgi:tetratricopeptide (TPR) repeat protein
MKLRLVHVAWLLLAVFVIGGCQSVATTSAKLRNEEGNYDLAINLARQAIAQNPNDAEAYFQLGVSYSHLDSVGLAYKNFMKSVELDANNKKREQDVNNNVKHNYSKHYNAGQAAFQDRDWNRAAGEFTKATMADPRESVAYYNLGVTYSRLAEEDSSYHEKAIDELDNALERATPDQSHYIDALALVGRELAEAGRVEEAISRFSRLMDEDPGSYEVIERLGSDRMSSQDWKGAAVFFEMAARARAKVGAEDHNIHFDIGRAYYNMRRGSPEAAAKAVESFERCLDLMPHGASDPDEQRLIDEQKAQTILLIMDAARALQNWGKVISWGERYVVLLPDDERGWLLLSHAYNEYGDKDKARDCAERYAEIKRRKEQEQ